MVSLHLLPISSTVSLQLSALSPRFPLGCPKRRSHSVAIKETPRLSLGEASITLQLSRSSARLDHTPWHHDAPQVAKDGQERRMRNTTVNVTILPPVRTRTATASACVIVDQATVDHPRRAHSSHNRTRSCSQIVERGVASKETPWEFRMLASTSR